MKCGFSGYLAGDPNIKPAKKQKTRLCEDCNTVISAAHNKKVCSACSNIRLENRANSRKKPK